VRALLMGGQACILYGAAEFSRDVDVAVLCDADNLRRLRMALRDLRAVRVYVPPLDARFLCRGHACHFRCRAPGVAGLRVDVMSVLRGCDPFEALWARRTSLRLPGAGRVEALSLPDLARAKRTQRDKDWVMLRRLVEADCFRARRPHPPERVRFWLLNLRTPDLLLSLAADHRAAACALASERPLLKAAVRGSRASAERGLRREEERERRADRRYWAPLRAELFRLRQTRRPK
jgi:hypothetical protein